MSPTIGRIVLYTNEPSDGAAEVRPAIVTGLNEDGSVALQVFADPGPLLLLSVKYTDEEAGSGEARGKWTWTEHR